VTWKNEEHSSNKFYPTCHESAIFDSGLERERNIGALIQEPQKEQRLRLFGFN
jgi:hypothetical protein